MFSGENGAVALQRKDDGIAWAGIDFDDFGGHFILHLQENAGEEGAFLDVVDDDARELGFQTEEHARHEVMGERAFLFNPVEGHGDGITYTVVDVNNEGLVVVPEEYGTAVNGWHYAFYGNLDDI